MAPHAPDRDDANSTDGRSREAPDPAAPEPDRFNGFNGFNYGGAPDPAAPEPGRINRINRIHPGKPRRTVDPDRVLTVQEAVAAACKAEVVFRAVGDTIEVDVPAGVSLPSNVQAALTQEALRAHLGMVYADQAAVDFLGRLGGADQQAERNLPLPRPADDGNPERHDPYADRADGGWRAVPRFAAFEHIRGRQNGGWPEAEPRPRSWDLGHPANRRRG